MMEQGLKLSEQYQVYCFDYYDTIACRTVEPEYVKRIWCKELKEHFCLKQDAEEIYRIRNKTEAALCQENQAAGYDLEFQYCTLLERMYVILFPEQGVSMEMFADVAEKLEYEIECRVQEICEDTIYEIKKLKSLNKKIICISDFYTSSDFLINLMNYHGIRMLFDEIYVSSDRKITKRSGKLYDSIIAETKIDPQDMFMVGDNSVADYEIPMQKGIHAYLIDRSAQKEKYREFLAVHCDVNYVKNALSDIYQKCDRTKYEDLAFALYGFIDKLYERISRGGIRDVFFLSREGEFLKKAFDTYLSKRLSGGMTGIRTHYLMVSRKATFIASLKPLAEEQFEMIFRQYVNISLFDFFSSLGFTEEVQNQLGERLGVDIRQKQEDLPRNPVFERVLQDEYFQEQYESLRIEQKNNFKEYLDSFGVDFEKFGMCLVDVGWKGTIQDNILMFFDEKVKILGLYLGLVAPGKVHDNNVKEGLLFTNIPSPVRGFHLYNENKSVFEVMLGASHGSADHYVRTDQGIQVATAEKKEERELYQNVISVMQDNIFVRMQEIDLALNNHCFEKDELERFVAKVHARLAFLPVREQINLFYHIYHYENFGVFEFTKFKTRERVGIKDRYSNLVKMLKHRRAFFQTSFWGVVALKDAGLGMLIKPYGWYMYNKYYRKEY